MLPDRDKTKEQLVSELALVRQRNAELATSEIKRMRAEETLRETRDYLNSLLQYANAPIIVWDTEQRITIFNTAFEQLTGYMAGEVIGQPLSMLFPEASRDESLTKIRQTLSGTYWESAEIPILCEDGEIRIALWNSANIYDKDGKTLLATIAQGQDITERKQVEEELLKNRDLLNETGKMAKVGGWEFDVETLRQTWTEEVYHIHELDTDYQPTVEKGINFYAPEAVPIISKAVQRTIEYGEPFDLELPFITAKGNHLWVHAIGKAYRKDGKTIRVGGTFQDITERKQAEEREEQLQQELSVSMRLAAIGELVAGVAHEINNPLTGVLGFSERLLRKSTDEEISQDLERIHNEAQRIVKVMDNLRTFAHRREPETRYSDINDVLQEALELRAYELKTGNIEVVTDFASSLPEIGVDFHQIQEVFLNIILNAEQVMIEAHSGGKLTIKTRKIKDYVRISFTDDGPGIPAEHLNRLFDPFFTTRGEKGGTGLGLSVCHGIVTDHGGRLYAKSRPEKGATFFVELPFS